MPRYLVQVSYSNDGLRSLQADTASGRRSALARSVAALGGRLETMYFVFGEEDAILIVDLPDRVSMATLALAATSSGQIRVKTTSLLTVEEMDQALQRSVGGAAS